ncbi:hypothetical protein AVEN_217847-1 [Araneus ventricosus]|uniref:Uncharacterized protein n=1 Tax=Araneus ventricosus TaxID=182803 RepID=A0A4Y2VFR6_ARAVE|nr:hypothetical protein AVEN_217847-1 [Araneus ventricosus]
MLKNGRTDVNDAYCEERPSTSSNAEMVARVNEHILANRRVTDAIANKMLGRHLSRHPFLQTSAPHQLKNPKIQGTSICLE